MMKKESLEVMSSREIAKETIEMVLKNAYISEHAVPGQFLHISIVGHTLRRPISIAAINQKEQLITILFKKIGSGTTVMASYLVGSSVDSIGHSWNVFSLHTLPS